VGKRLDELEAELERVRVSGAEESEAPVARSAS
jgi:hypothetical protein